MIGTAINDPLGGCCVTPSGFSVMLKKVSTEVALWLFYDVIYDVNLRVSPSYFHIGVAGSYFLFFFKVLFLFSKFKYFHNYVKVS